MAKPAILLRSGIGLRVAATSLVREGSRLGDRLLDFVETHYMLEQKVPIARLDRREPGKIAAF
jgi:hypothetical protein